MVRKILNRGTAPPLHPHAERSLLEASGWGATLIPSRLPGDIAPRIRRGPTLQASLASVRSWPLDQFDDLTDAASPGESAFLAWLHDTHPDALRWCVPQPSFDQLRRANGADGAGCRRCDFLISVPGASPFVVEIDGAHHDSQVLTDAERDSLLAEIGIETLRVPSEEIYAGAGPSLDVLADRLDDLPELAEDLEPLVWVPIQVHRLVLALCEAVQAGFLSGDAWTVRLVDPTGLAAEMVGPYLGLLDALERLWGTDGIAPNAVTFWVDDIPVSYRRAAPCEFARDGTPTGQAQAVDCVIRLECQASPIEPLPERTTAPQIVVRSSSVPVMVSDPPIGAAERITVRTAGGDCRRALQEVLRAVFAKEDFREGQFEAIVELLEGRDCTVLLPTGAGKSLIYQLAGLCLPGRTLVIDPIVALIEDQISGLAAHGIDRAVGISGATTRAGMTAAMLDRVADADAYFVLVAPERLQMAPFRAALRELANATPINVAVVDEAHCVSEWGHNFRTSYLNLGKTIRHTCSDPAGNPPPVLALTGTASRAVLKDVLFQLGIEERSANSIVRPHSFDRPELHLRIVRTESANDEATLKSIVKQMPGRFDESDQTFFQPAGEQTYSGLVFVPTVKGRHGLLDTQRALAGITSTGIYSGGPPAGFSDAQWATMKTATADRFKANLTPVLVTTNAFGMGIDKPNIRWVVHYGLPSSLEAYYQEVGRAGRDGQAAECTLILSEFAEQRNAQLLSEDVSLEDARDRQSAMARKERDDVTTALFFHVQSFPGIDEEVQALIETFDLLGADDQPRHVTIPFGTKTDRERALYRLTILGIVADFLVDWGAKTFDVRTSGATPAQVVDELLAFVDRSQPGRLDAIRERVDHRYPKLAQAIEACGRAMVEFVYETIERSRRRSMREMYLAAKESDTDSALRERVLDYLSEGDIVPSLDRLVDLGTFRFADWIPVWQADRSANAARELRAASARLLASYPSHPGLLATRGLAEGILPDGNLEEFESNLESALRSAVAEYQATAEDVESAMAWMVGTVGQRRPAAMDALVGAVILAGVQSEAIDTWLADHWADGTGTAVFRLAAVLERTDQLARSAALNLQEF